MRKLQHVFQTSLTHHCCLWFCAACFGYWLQVPPMLVKCDPPHGMLAATQSASVNISVTGCRKGHHRLLLRITSNSSRCSTCAVHAITCSNACAGGGSGSGTDDGGSCSEHIVSGGCANAGPLAGCSPAAVLESGCGDTTSPSGVTAAPAAACSCWHEHVQVLVTVSTPQVVLDRSR